MKIHSNWSVFKVFAVVVALCVVSGYALAQQQDTTRKATKHQLQLSSDTTNMSLEDKYILSELEKVQYAKYSENLKEETIQKALENQRLQTASLQQKLQNEQIKAEAQRKQAEARQRQQEAEVVGEVLEGTCDGLVAGQLLGFQRLPIGGQHELGLALGGGGACQQRGEGLADIACRAGGDVDVVAQQDTVGQIRGVVVAAAQALERNLLVAEGGQEGIGKLSRIKGLQGQFRDGLFDFYGVHADGGIPAPGQMRAKSKESCRWWRMDSR